MWFFFLFVAFCLVYLIWKYWTFLIGAGYDPTPARKVRRMLLLAGMKPQDVLYDLGCGDGRLLIAAVRDFGGRAVGIEADPVRWLIARWKVRRAGLQNRIRVRWGNFFQIPISEATVVSLFLYQPVNNRLKAKFLKELNKGTRIVTNTWTIEGWKEKKRFASDDLYLYCIE